MSETLRRIAEALEDGGEEEAAAFLGALGAQRRQQGSVRGTPKTPLPLPGSCSAVHCEVEWV